MACAMSFSPRAWYRFKSVMAVVSNVYSTDDALIIVDMARGAFVVVVVVVVEDDVENDMALNSDSHHILFSD